MGNFASKKNILANVMDAEERPLTYAELRSIAGGDLGVRRFVSEGLVEKVSGGLYARPGRDTTWQNLSSLAARHPEAVVCLDTAAVYYGLADFNPSRTHVAFPVSKRIPVDPELGVQGYRWTAPFLEIGVETVRLQGVDVKITSRARTVVDFLRRRDRTGGMEEAGKVLAGYLARGRGGEVIAVAKQLGVDGHVRSLVQMIEPMHGVKVVKRGIIT